MNAIVVLLTSFSATLNLLVPRSQMKKKPHNSTPYILLIALLPMIWWFWQISFWYGAATIFSCTLLAKSIVPEEKSWYEEPSYLDMFLGAVVISCSVALLLKFIVFLIGINYGI